MAKRNISLRASSKWRLRSNCRGTEHNEPAEADITEQHESKEHLEAEMKEHGKSESTDPVEAGSKSQHHHESNEQVKAESKEQPKIESNEPVEA